MLPESARLTRREDQGGGWLRLTFLREDGELVFVNIREAQADEQTIAALAQGLTRAGPLSHAAQARLEAD